MLNDELERIYREANGVEEGKRAPLTTEAVFAAMRAAVIAEREACAKLCERMKSKAWADEAVVRAHNTAASNCAAAIRVRPNSN